MPSILTRLRERARTLSFTRVPPSPSLLSSPSVPTIPLPTTRATHNDTTTITHAATNTMTSMTTASRLDRKILANPDAHLTSYESNDTHEHGNEQQHGHRGRGGNQDAAERVEFPVGLQPGPRRASGSGSVVLALRDTAERHERSNIEANTDEGESRRHSGEGGASGGEWTTFGRRQSGAGRTPRLNEFFFQQETAHEFKGKDESVKEKNTNSSPSNTLSSRAPGVGLESLETFGARTPELPLEGYPALIPVLFPMITESKNDMREEAQRTFPRHRLRSWAMRSGTSSQSLPNTLKLKKSKERSYATFLKQFQASPSRKSSSNNMDFDSMPNSPPRISRSASRSNKSLRSGRTPRRRASAEWYAFQASQNSEGQWPALVSREILRLSGAGGVEVDATGGNPASANGSLMADHEATIHLIPPQPAGSDEARYCDGFPARIALPTSQSLTQLSPEGNHPDASCILSESGPSQPHGLFINSSSASIMAQPKQEIFQFEKAGRGNGNEIVSSNGRPIRRARKPSDPALLRSLQTEEPQLLQTPPSLSVTSPTPLTSPYPHSPASHESQSLQLPPALKTPSDKSKGKRKAEDVDTTPPEAKRATFAPIEPRTVRIKLETHHTGKRTNPTKNNHACTGLPSSSPSRSRRCSAHPVDRARGGLRGSCIWNFDERPTDGACGDTSAEIGIDIPDKLVRRSCVWPWLLFGCEYCFWEAERPEVAREGARGGNFSGEPRERELARLAHEP